MGESNFDNKNLILFFGDVFGCNGCFWRVLLLKKIGNRRDDLFCNDRNKYQPFKIGRADNSLT